MLNRSEIFLQYIILSISHACTNQNMESNASLPNVNEETYCEMCNEERRDVYFLQQASKQT